MDKRNKFKFSAVFLTANKPTMNGNIYSIQMLHQIKEQFRFNKIIVQEMNPVERKIKNVPIQEPWMKQVMADVTAAEIVEDNLVFYAETRLSREGDKLAGIIRTIGIENVIFFPVGYGGVNINKEIKPGYKLNYIAIEPKK